MTQKARVLSMLQAAGPKGVRSDAFYREFNGRGVARIYDLRKEGYEISDEREGKYKRYYLLSDHHAASHSGRVKSDDSPEICVETSAAKSQEGRAAGGLKRSVPSMFDADDHLNWAA